MQSDEMTPWECPETLSTVERLSLANQFKILSALNYSDPDETLRYQQLAQIVQSGYTEQYYLVFGDTEPEISKTNQRQLNHILGMFRDINHGLVALDSATRKNLLANAKVSIKFEGFCFNNLLEYRLHQYLMFLLSIGNWADMKSEVDSVPDFGHSDSPRLPQYLKLVSIYEEIKQEMESRSDLASEDKFVLNAGDLLRLTSGS
jgi:uncharacterized protein YfbU (UPF0304 family)